MPSIIAVVGANISAFSQQMDEAQRKSQSTGDGIGGAFAGIGSKLGAAMAGFASFSFLKQHISEAADYAGKIEDIHLRTTVSRESLQAWDLVLQQNGSNVQAAVGFFEKLAVARQKAFSGDDKSVEAFQKLGVSMDDLKSKRIEDIGADIGKAFGAGDPQKLFPFLKTIGGKGAGELVQSFRSGDFSGQLEGAMGGGISDLSIRELDAAGDSVTRAKAGFRAGVGEMAGTFITRMKDIGDFFTGNLSAKELLLNRGARMRESREGITDNKAFAAPVEDEETDKEKKEKEERLKRIAKLTKDISDAERKDKLEDMTDAQKLQALQSQSFEQRTTAQFGKDEEARLVAKKESLKTEDEIKNLQEKMGKDSEKLAKDKKKEEEKLAKADKKDMRGITDATGAASASGGFLGTYMMAPEVAGLDLQRKSEGHLAEMKKTLQKIAEASVVQSSVDFG